MIDDDQLPKVTAAMLRRAETMCGLKLSHDFANHGGNRLGSARFRISNQLAEHARLAQLELGPPQEAAFRPLGLEPEELRVYEHSATSYFQVFGDRPARSVDHDEWETVVPELGVRLVGNGGLPFEDERGRRELRHLSLGPSRADPADPLTAITTRFSLLRHAAWAAGERVRLIHVDLVFGEVIEHVVDVEECLAQLRPWLDERVAMVQERVREPQPHVGLECGRCKFVVRCPAHRV